MNVLQANATWDKSKKGYYKNQASKWLYHTIFLFAFFTLGQGFTLSTINGLEKRRVTHTKLHSSSALWRNNANVDILLPDESNYPLGIIHFIGGAVVGAAPKTTYKLFLEGLSEAGFLVLATPIGVNEFNHQSAACEAARQFSAAYREVEDYYGVRATARIPVFGVGHSLGAKLQTLISSYPEVHSAARPRKANVLVSFNNFSAKDSVPLLTELRNYEDKLGGMKDTLNQVTEAVQQVRKATPIFEKLLTDRDLELAEKLPSQIFSAVNSALSDVPEDFRPNPEETWRLIEDSYSVKNNMIVQFRNDNIDQSPYLAQILEKKYGLKGDLHFATLDGSHVTPNTQDIEDTTNQILETNSNLNSPWVGEMVAKVGSTAMLELDDLVRTVGYYLRAQSLWSKEEIDALPWDDEAM